ncbi:DUF1285 domain-containing protein [Psychrobacter sp.]|uniref:DUF1285 domain-containing protein n=1 Tax=Psychrobacter sp. TaxID=56811 RepID=UPI003C75B85F
MSNDNNKTNEEVSNSAKAPTEEGSSMNNIDALSQYLKSATGSREGRAIPPLDKWHPEDIADMDLVIKANGEWWHEGGQMTRESLVNLFATILWKEENNGVTEYFLKTPVQKIRIQVEDAPLLINDVGIVHEDNVSWLEFTTTTGDVVRLDDEHRITLQAYNPKDNDPAALADHSLEVKHNNLENESLNENADRSKNVATDEPVRPYMLVRNGLTALIGRNTFYHLAEIGELTERNGETILTLQSGGQAYSLSMPTN